MIAVIGATGNVGRPLVEQLSAAGETVVGIAREAATPRPGVTFVEGDLARLDTLRGPLNGASAVFVLLASEAHHGVDPVALMEVVKGSGARRAVVLSSMGAVTRPEMKGYDALRALEAAAIGCGLPVTLLRPTGFDTNTLAWLEGIKRARTVAAPFADVAIPLVDPADIAAVAAAALRTSRHEGAVYTLTGPAPVTPREQVEAIAAAIGVALRFESQTREQAVESMRHFMPMELVEATLQILGTPTAQERRVSPDVERVLGRPATSYAAWARRNAQLFR